MNTNPSAKQILCFGDSNTWGYIPNEGLESVYRRYPANIRYPGVLQAALGSEWNVIEDGVNSRTIEAEDRRPGKDNRRAVGYLTQCLYAHDPLDYAVIFIGTNELKSQFGLSPQSVAQEIISLLEYASTFQSQLDRRTPKVIAVIPPAINSGRAYAEERFKNGLERSEQLREGLSKSLAEKSITFVDCFELNDLGADGLHLTEEGHHKLGVALAEIITNKK